MEVAERLGPTLDYWRGQPFAFLLWSFHHLQELDRRRTWVARMHRIEAGGMTAMAFHDPKLLDKERDRALADAAAGPSADDIADVQAHGLRMVNDLNASGALNDGTG